MLHMPIRSYTLAIDYTWRSILDPISSINDIRYALGGEYYITKTFCKPEAYLTMNFRLRDSESFCASMEIHQQAFWFRLKNY